jgi:hypothetical protein
MKNVEVHNYSRWLTPNDVAKPTNEGGYDIPKQTQSKMRMNRTIPYSKISSKFIRYDRYELDRWLEEHAIVKIA